MEAAKWVQSRELSREQAFETAPVTALAASGSIKRPKSERRAGRSMAAQEKGKVDLSPVDFAAGTPTRSVTQIGGAQERSTMRSVGLDLGAKKIFFCEVRDGRVVMRRTVSSLADLDDVLGSKSPEARVAIEACREAWHVHDVLVESGHEVQVVDTTRVKRLGIGQHGRKTDRIDAEVLAHAVEDDLIPEAHVLTPHRRALRTHMMVRRGLVETRSQMVTTVRGIVRASGKRIRTCAPETFVAQFLESELPSEVLSVCAPLVQVLDALEPQIRDIDLKIVQLAEGEPAIRLLMTAPGVGLMVAAMFVSVVDDAKRFTKAHQLESYLGLVPSEDTSGGGKRRIGAISKHGNAYLRSLLVEGAWTLLRGRPASDQTPRLSDPLRAWADGVAQRRGRPITAIAVARRLAGILWAMWRDGTVYDPGAVGRASASGKTAEAQSTLLRATAIARATKKAKRYDRGPTTRRTVETTV